MVPTARLGPTGPFPDTALEHPLERRWLHYAFLSRPPGLAMVANLSTLTPDGDDRPQDMRILLLHEEGRGWTASQFNATPPERPWSAFRLPGAGDGFELAARSGVPSVELALTRTSRPCTSQCAPFGDGMHLRWQSESGVLAEGRFTTAASVRHDAVRAVGYHERVRGRWGWPELGGWVFGFANDVTEALPGDPAPPWAVVFTLLQPSGAPESTTGSVMVWRRGRLRRHFPRRTITVAVQGRLDPDRVELVPPLARLLATPPAAPVPARLVVCAGMGGDRLVLDVACRTAGRIANPSETSLRPFSVHEVVGDCRVEGRISGLPVAFEAEAIVEFAGCAGG